MQKVKSNLLTAGVCILIAFICIFGYVMLQNLCAEIFIRVGWEERRTFNLLAYGFWFAFIVHAILPPLYEEFIFRFLLCKGLGLTKLKKGWIVIISAVIFMLYHRSWSQVVYQLIMGIFFAWIFIKTNNLVWTIFIHFINNAFVITYTYIAADTGSAVFPLTPLNITLALVLAVISTVAVIFLIKKGIPHAKRQ